MVDVKKLSFALVFECRLLHAQQLSGEVIHAIAENERNFNEIAIAWERARHLFVSQDELEATLTGADSSFCASERVVLEIQDGVIYLSRESDVREVNSGEWKGRVIHHGEEQAWDGEVYCLGLPIVEGSSIGSPSLVLEPRQMVVVTRRTEHVFDPELLQYMGLRWPRTGSELENGRQIHSTLNGASEEAEGRVIEVRESDGLTCIKIRSEASIDVTVEWKLDPRTQYMPRTREERLRGKLISIGTCDEFRSLGTSSLSVPHVCTVTYYQWRGQPVLPSDSPLFVDDYAIERLSRADIESRLMDNYAKPGTYVFDRRRGKDARYSMSASWLELSRVVETVQPRFTIRHWSGESMYSQILAGGLLVGALLTWAWHLGKGKAR